VPLDVPKGAYTFDITGETDYRIEQRPALRGIGLQRSIELFDINSAAVLTLLFVTFHEETTTVVNLKARQRIENDIAEIKMVYEPFVFVFKIILDIFYVFNGLLACLDEFALTFGIKSGEK